jgi:hypothetical protein
MQQKKVYTIEVSGRGADCYIHELTEEQREKLVEGGVDEDEMSMDEICEVLEKDFITDTETVLLGAYFDNDLCYVKVTDQEGKDVWETTDLTIFDEDEDYEVIHDEENLLIVEDLLKGEFFKYKLELEEEFDPVKLTAVVKEVGEMIPLITGLRYDGKKLEVDEFGDYWDKGFNFYLT